MSINYINFILLASLTLIDGIFFSFVCIFEQDQNSILTHRYVLFSNIPGHIFHIFPLAFSLHQCADPVKADCFQLFFSVPVFDICQVLAFLTTGPHVHPFLL